ncbi:glycosyltransferase family 2 protein [Jannaschia seohaensis]|nr:glycosyltransferase family 2 protein [Jannaschia seohaensis]
MNNAPRIAAFLGVKDEVGLIEAAILHLRAIGVDHIIACDISSTDGTGEILDAYRSRNFEVLTLPDEAIGSRINEPDGWFAQAKRMYEKAPADWVMFLDADEFWLPATGNIKDCIAQTTADVLTVNRYNVVLGPHGPCVPGEMRPDSFDRILLFADRVAKMQLALQADENIPWIRGQVGPKILARINRIEGVTAGQHAAISDHPDLRRAKPSDLIIAHVGLSTLSRFERKLQNLRQIYEREGIDFSDPDESWKKHNVAWHWRRWATLHDFDAEFRKNMLRSEEIDDLRWEGVIQSAGQILSGLDDQSSRNEVRVSGSIQKSIS